MLAFWARLREYCQNFSETLSQKEDFLDIPTCGHNRLQFRQDDAILELAGLELAGLELAAMHAIRPAKSGLRHVTDSVGLQASCPRRARRGLRHSLAAHAARLRRE